jgi:hypothetical protein
MIWCNDVLAFLSNKDSWTNIIPTSDQTLHEQLNAVVMFAIYFTAGMLLIKKDIRCVYFLVGICALSWFVWKQQERNGNTTKEKFQALNIDKDIKNNYCLKPSIDNPFMNVTLKDYEDFPNRPKACNIENVADQIDTFFSKGLQREDNDVFHKGASDRQYYTTPSTTIPNGRDEFTNFLFDLKPTLKQAGQQF